MTNHESQITNRDGLAIVGIGCLFPKAAGLDEYWANIKAKVDGIGPVPSTHWNPDDYFDADPKRPDMTYARRGGFLDPVPFPPAEFGIAPNDLEATDTSQLLALIVAKMALDNVSPRVATRGREPRTSVILGVTGTLELVVPLGARLGHPMWRRALRDCGVEDSVAERVVERISRGYVGWQENSFPGLLGNVVAGRVANRLDLHGTNCVVDAACASSLSAIHLAAMELQTGKTDIAITGGVDTFNDIFMYMCFSKTPALSPTGDAKPFDANGDGTILGEGLGILVLKRLADAERDGNRIYAVIKGMGTSSDGKGNAVYAPSSAGQVRCLQDAYANAGVTPDTIELIEAHGTGTKVGDKAELDGLTQVFRDAPSRGRQPPETSTWCALGSVKSQLGHTKAAAGAAGLIKAALALYHKVLPPTIKVTQPLAEPGTTPFYINTEPRPWLPREHPRRAGVSAFGFGGSNYHCVLEEYDRRKPDIDWDGDIAILALNGARSASKGGIEPLRALRAPWNELQAAAAESRRNFDCASQERLILVVRRGHVPDPAAIRDWLNDPSRPAPDGAYFGTGPAPGKLAFLFPGQGSQSVGMLRDLACTFPAMQDALAEADRAFGDERRLSDLIYPQPAFTAEARTEQETTLRATNVAQPALGAVSLGAMRVLRHFGVEPDATAGHSYGELLALCAAGCLDEPTLFALSRVRGQLMAEQRNGDAGAMLAVQAPLEHVESLLVQEKLDLVIANRNGPTQAVLSGRTAEIERAAQALQTRRMTHIRLPVAAAFHSPLVADAAAPFRQALRSITLNPARLPVFANTTAREYPADPAAMGNLLAQQLAEPVEFVNLIRNMAGAGVHTFVEVGPGRTLTKLVNAILGDRPHAAVALDASAGQRSGMLDLAHALARLAAMGYPVRVSAWDPDPPTPRPKPALTVPICGANYRKPATSAEFEVRNSEIKASPAKPPPAKEATTVDRPSPTPNSPLRTPHLEALRVTQESLAAFQRLQEQTAQLHKQFLESQEAAQKTLQTLVEGQQRIVSASLGMPVAAPVRPSTTAPLPQSRERGENAAPPAAPTPVTPAIEVAVATEIAARPTPTPAPAPAPVSLPSTAGVANKVQSVLIEIIAEKTGYPPEMLGPDMKLDADLGIDSIKRVEILSALQDRLPDAPIIKPEHLGTLHTLREIADFLCAGTPAIERNEIGARSKPAPAPVSLPSTAGVSAEVQKILIEIIAEKTGYPPEMLGPDMKLDADLGIDSIKRVEILSALQDKLPDAPIIKPEHLGTLHTLREIADFLTTGTPTIEPSEIGSDSKAPVSLRSTTGVTAAVNLDRRVVRVIDAEAGQAVRSLPAGAPVWVVAEDSRLTDALFAQLQQRTLKPERFRWNSPPPAAPAELAGLVLVAPADGNDAPMRALNWMQTAGKPLRTNKGIFATLTSLDGQFGSSDAGPNGDPRQGAFAGLAKTASHEWQEVLCKAIDVASDAPMDALADELVCGGPVEIGLLPHRRVTLGASLEPMGAAATAPFGRNDVIVVTGGARGVTAEVAVELARGGATFVLLGRNPAPAVEPAELAGCRDELSLKRTLASRGGATPKQIDAEVRSILAAREIRGTLDRIAEAGGRAIYRSVDVRDPSAVQSVIADIRQTVGTITGLIHGAGVLADRKIEDLTAEQFDAVYSTKVAGLQNLLDALGCDPLQALVVFSSSTGRYGRAGQAAYAAANEALNKIAQRESRARPNCRVVSLNWGPWAGGMVTPALAQLFASENIALIPLADGARHLVAELSSPDRAVEVVVLGPGSAVPEVRTADAQSEIRNPRSEMAPVFERDIDLNRSPVLRAHVIDGRAVLPLALTLEWLAHAAMHGHPGLVFHGCDNLRVFHPVTVRERAMTPIQAFAGKAVAENGVHRVPVELRGRRADGQPVVHSRAEMLLGGEMPRNAVTSGPLSLPAFALDTDDVYQRVLFHGPELRGIEQIVGCGPAGIVVIAQNAPAPSAWLDQPQRGQWLADPLVLDCAFQAMSVWCHAQRGAVSLPSAVGRYRQYQRFTTSPTTIVARVRSSRGQIVAADIDFLDPAGAPIARIDDFECVLDPSLNQAFRRNRLEPAGA